MTETLPRFPICHPRVAAAKGPASSLLSPGFFARQAKNRRARMTEGDNPSIQNAPFRMALQRSTRIVFEVVPLCARPIGLTGRSADSF
jgi:hypothetical protein